MSDNLSYSEQIIKFRQERDQRMLANPRNWLALVGLFWLEKGENAFGSDIANKIAIPSFPFSCCGSLFLDKGQVSLVEFHPQVTLNGSSPTPRTLYSDADDTPDLIEIGTISLMVIRRGEYILLRAWDSAAPAVKDFSGLHYFSIDENFCIPARFTPYEPPKTIMIQDMIGGQHEAAVLGKVDFSVNGVACSLEVEDAGDEGLINFVDETKKDKSYPGGRFITLPTPIIQQVSLDFNMAMNWPCAYTSYATCPLPPPENQLPVRIEAGEMRYHD